MALPAAQSNYGFACPRSALDSALHLVFYSGSASVSSSARRPAIIAHALRGFGRTARALPMADQQRTTKL